MEGLFDIGRPSKSDDISIAKKSNSKSKAVATTRKSGSDLLDYIKGLKDNIEKYLGDYKDKYIAIRDIDTLHEYVNAIIENDSYALDTETTGLDPLDDDIAGVCLYTPGQKGAYIPINHVSYLTGVKLDNQIPIDDVKRELERLVNVSELIEFNADFDTRICRHKVGVNLVCSWDAYLGARLLNENEKENKLKPLHQKYCLNGEGDAFSFAELFDKKIKFTYVPIDIAYLYAARDPEITYELGKYQQSFLRYDSDREDLRRIRWVMDNIEMPCVQVVADMEDIGVELDLALADEYSVKYHKLLDNCADKFYTLIDEYTPELNRLRRNGVKLDEPINISSNTQLAVLLYDIMKLPMPYDKKKKKYTRGTGEEILKAFDTPICDAILEYRGIEKLLSTYIDKLPNDVKSDGRIHCKFNQYGADTGRFSSSEPNLQNIPSHNKEIRKMFKATDGYVLMSSDFSQQEPKCLAALCRMNGDSQMYDTFMQGKDLYSEIASKAFNKSYDECREFRDDGSTNKEGKERRSQAKSILLGVLYGRGVPSIAEQLGTTTENAQSIKNSVFKGFPAIRQFEQESIHMAETLGYVTTVCGRKRRLPSMTLPDYEVKWLDAPVDDDPLSFDTDLNTEVPMHIQKKWIAKVKSVPFKNKHKVFEQANSEGLWIVDNTKDKEVTKIVNARIQGSAADLTKLAMIELANNAELKELGFRLLIPVHDEVIAECPEENMRECSRMLAETMSRAAEKILEMPIKCDVEITKCWYGGSII